MRDSVNACGGTGMKLRMKRIFATAAVLVIAAANNLWAQSLQEVTGFGSNPGNLRMFKYLPSALPANSPLIVALHGCKQSASAYDTETGWVGIADTTKSALLLPQQQSANNFNMCFNWFEAGDIESGEGEALSIKQMIDKMKETHAIDPARIFVTGLSAGGAMTSVMLATYPEVFAGGAIIAGLPYKCATSIPQAFGCMNPGKDLTPATWGALGRNASSFNGPWPRISIWHGSADPTVTPMNAQELVDQWTNVQGIDKTADGQDTVHGHDHKVFKDAGGTVRVETYIIAGMGHGTPISPGPGAEQCGTPGQWILDAGICSSYHIAKFWGLDSTPLPTPHPVRDQLLERMEKLKEHLNVLEAKIRQVNQ